MDRPVHVSIGIKPDIQTGFETSTVRYLPAVNHNAISVRVGVPRYVVRICKPWRVYPDPGCAQVAAISEITDAIAMTQRQVGGTASVPTLLRPNGLPTGGTRGRSEFVKFCWLPPSKRVKV